MWGNSREDDINRKIDALIEIHQRKSQPDVQIARIHEKLISISEKQVEILKRFDDHNIRIKEVEKASWRYMGFERSMKRVLWAVLAALLTGVATTWDKIHKVFS